MKSLPESIQSTPYLVVYAYNISTWVTEAAIPEGSDHLQLYIKFKASSGYILSSKLAWAIENLASREGKQKQGQGGRKTIREEATKVTQHGETHDSVI